VDVYVFNRDCRFVNENTDRERQPAERHNVDRLSKQPEPDQRGHNCERDGHHDDHRASPVTQKQEHDQSGQQGSKQTFGCQSANPVPDTARLVELETDMNIFRNQCLHLRQFGTYAIDDIDRRGVGALCYRNVDGFAFR
jgi:hypothetical protein